MIALFQQFKNNFMFKNKFSLFFLILFIFFKGISQTYQATLKSLTNNEIIPYASIQYAPNKGIISNEEGKFSIDINSIQQDSIYISSVGFLKKGFAIKNLTDSVLYLNEAVENLDLVYLTKNNYSADEIMQLVKENIDSNYIPTLTNQKIFYRQSFITTVRNFDMEMKESTIPEINEKLLDSIQKLIPKKSEHYNEMLGNYYSDSENEKLTISKAAELYDKNMNLSMEGISKKMETIFKDNIKRNSYIKFKSGIFGTKVQVDSILAANEDAKKLEEKLKDSTNNEDGSTLKLKYVKQNIKSLYNSLFYQEDSKFNLIDKLNRYVFSLEGFTLINDEPCYIVKFLPKGNKEFKGTLHINVNDFAIVQMDFSNVKVLKDFSLLGISYSENLYTSKVFFRKVAQSYLPYFIQLDKGISFGIKRPFSIIEKNKYVKGRKKQNEVALKIEVNIDELERFEFLVYETNTINQETFNKLQENEEFKATYLEKYDASFWADENIMAPNKAIQNFSTQTAK